ncbi:sulfate transporter family protein [Pinisolibacter sp.]|uniref:sulfate transporter family protein n=1 Tax=Pinisolibacter sp. TaxID=2172024 RepID=UPI002FDE78DC
MAEGVPTGTIVASIRDGVADLMTPPFRGVIVRSLGVTLAIVAVVWAIGTRLLTGSAVDLATVHPVDLPYWLTAVRWIAGLFSGAALMVALSFLVAPITAGVAGLFLDEVADVVERTHYAGDRPGTPLPVWPSLVTALRFAALSLAVNLVALPLVLFAGSGLIIFTLANGWLIGREYFEFAAARHVGIDEARRLRRIHAGPAFLAGLAAAALLSVPILNLATPLFATATMVHLAKRLTGGRR